MIKVVCIKSGKRFPLKSVLHLQRMVASNLPVEHDFICLTDQKIEKNDFKVTFIDVSQYRLSTWSKMLLFNEDILGDGPVLYLDLDVVVTGDIQKIINRCVDITLCKSKRYGEDGWPCRFNSSVIILPDNFYRHDVWLDFNKNSWQLMTSSHQFGVDWIIEKLYPSADYLQELCEEDYLLHIDDVTDKPNKETSLVMFDKKSNPFDTEIEWIRDSLFSRYRNKGNH